MSRTGTQEPLIFCSFQDRDMAFERVKTLWRNVSPHAAAKYESDFDEDSPDKMLSSGRDTVEGLQRRSTIGPDEKMKQMIRASTLNNPNQYLRKGS